MMNIFKYITSSVLILSMQVGSVSAQATPINLERAKGEKLATAIGHYARSRSLLIAAVREFDQGLMPANPKVLIDVKEFRNTLLDRAEDLEKILAPQPRATKRGVQFAPDSRHLGETAASARARSNPTNLERAEGEELVKAIHHYAQSRSLLLASVREFDAGLKHANPQVLVDVKEFRNTLLDRAEDLDKILAPQPKETKRGVQFAPDSRLLGEAYR